MRLAAGAYAAGEFNMSISFGCRGVRTLGMFPAVVLLLCASLLVALEAPSKPFLEKNSFYLSSAGVPRATRQRSRCAEGDARVAGASLRDPQIRQ
jgi:hypothetical protein